MLLFYPNSCYSHRMYQKDMKCVCFLIYCLFLKVRTSFGLLDCYGRLFTCSLASNDVVIFNEKDTLNLIRLLQHISHQDPSSSARLKQCLSMNLANALLASS